MAQPLSNDTIICIVDTTNSFTSFIENPYRKDTSYHWNVAIKGHYYDGLSKEDADLACLVFSTSFTGVSWIKKPDIIKIPVSDINNKYTTVTDRWLNQQKDLNIIGKKLGNLPFSKYNFVIFQQDLENNTTGYIKVYQVLYGYNSVQY